jgi:hypothetical protein
MIGGHVMKNSSSTIAKRRLSVVWLPLFGMVTMLVGCSSSSSGPGGNDDVGLSCEQEGYPCSLAEVPPAVRDATWAALETAYDALAAGTMEDAVSSLEARDDFAEIVRDGRIIRFRLEGGGPAYLYDIRGLSPPESDPSLPRERTDAIQGARRATTSDKAVVGGDRNGDGSEDNRDPKRALFMSPYKWEFSPWDEGDILASNFGSVPPYQGEVDYVENPTEASQNITVEDWRSWYLYDFIYVSTHGGRIVSGQTTYVVISSGVQADAAEALPETGAWLFGMVDNDAAQSNRIIEYGLDLDFFRASYGEGLSDTMVVFSACETGAEGASELADAIGGDDFVMMGWTETVYSSDAFPAATAFLENLTKGLRADEALARLVSTGLLVGDPVPARDGTPGRPPVFTRFAPAGGDQRLFEVPTLLDAVGSPLVDGANIAGLLEGTPGDGEPDRLRLTVRLDGVEEGSEPRYSVRYALGGQPAGGTYDLSNAVRTSDATVEVEHVVDLGFDAPLGTQELMAIVDLPEGGESRYVASTRLFVCSHDAVALGALADTSDFGPTTFLTEPDGRLLFSFNGWNQTGFGSRFTIPAGTPLQPGSVAIASADLLKSFPIAPYAFYIPGDVDFDCAECGGELTITSVDEGGDFVAGTATYTMVSSLEGDPPVVGPLTTVEVEFRAANADSNEPDSPVEQCRDQYRMASDP